MTRPAWNQATDPQRCPHCSETKQIEAIPPHGFFCQTCAKTWRPKEIPT